MIEEIDHPICFEPDCDAPASPYTWPEEAEEIELDEVTTHNTVFFCHKHAGENGFCIGCGQFWGGVESFEFGHPNIDIKLCDDCASSFWADHSDLVDESGRYTGDDDWWL